MLKDTTVIRFRQPDAIDDPLTELAREGARRMLAQALIAEADAFVALRKDLKLPDGRDRVVRHGHGPHRAIQTGVGPVEVRRAKVRDRGEVGAEEKIRFTSSILPKWARRTKSLDALLPVLYLRGVSTGDFQEALAALLGKDAPNLSPAVITRLTATCPGSSGRRNTLREEVAMTVRKRRSDRSGRSALPSPGRPSVARREDHRQFWAAIAAGRSSEDAAVGAGVSPAVGARWFRRAGGMPPSHLAPSAKPLSGRSLSFAEREEIATWRAQRQGVREIARQLGRAPSTISRELRRNAATRGGGLEYRATTAQWHAERSARRPKPAKLATNAALRAYVQERSAGHVAAPGGATLPGPAVPWKGRRHGPRQNRRWGMAWSPQQIAERLRLDFPDDAAMRVSHEAIYGALYVQGRGALRRELTQCLRTGRTLRVPRARTRGRGKSFVTPEVLISERPAEVAGRAVPGHWEGDLILGLRGSAIGTLVERTTRFTMLLHLPPMQGHGAAPREKNGPALAGHGAEAVRDAIGRAVVTLPRALRMSLTWDQGAEMAQHT